MLDLIHRTDVFHKCKYVWFDTGLEYQATKDHLEYLRQRYSIPILTRKPLKSIPLCVKEHGVPFINKYASDQIYRLQSHGFGFEDEDYESLLRKYPKCVSALKWWCSIYDNPGHSSPSYYSISRNKWLREFLIENPPRFSISSKCCDYAKKGVAKQAVKELSVDLQVVGVRKSEGGIRAGVYHSCFGKNKGIHMYRPLFWYSNRDKDIYCNKAGIIHSRCYSEWGFTRTGCCCCPFGRDVLHELDVVREFEPNMYKAAWNIFRKSYEYTLQYREFVDFMNKKRR